MSPYEQMQALAEAVNRELDPLRLLRGAIEHYNEQMARINERGGPR